MGLQSTSLLRCTTPHTIALPIVPSLQAQAFLSPTRACSSRCKYGPLCVIFKPAPLRRNRRTLRTFCKDQAAERINRELPAPSGSQQRVHFIGIGGAGLSALALVALKTGWRVTGSDAVENERTKALERAGADVCIGHAASNLVNELDGKPPDVVVVTSAVKGTNPEVEQAHELGVKVLKRSEWLGWITESYELLAVAGSHGKSTTSAMLALVLQGLGEDVTAVVGAEVPQFPDGGNAMVGSSPRFVLEADEYDGAFLGVSPSIAVVTCVEWEHVDLFPDEASVRALFRSFVQRIRPGGTLIVCGDSAGSRSLRDVFQESPDSHQLAASSGGQVAAPWLAAEAARAGRTVITYGLAEDNDWRAMALVPNPQGGTDFTVVHANKPLARVHLKLPGIHNSLNALAVLVVASVLASRSALRGGVSKALAVAASRAANCLSDFRGVKRRFEFLGKRPGVHVFDDYAHHPTEVRATLQAARQRFDQAPLWVVFQPHTFSRLAKLLEDFAPAFSAADRVIVTEVYAAREENEFNISGADLAAAITGPPAIYVPKLEDVIERLRWEFAARCVMGDEQEVILLTLGAGDVTQLGGQLLQSLDQEQR